MKTKEIKTWSLDELRVKIQESKDKLFKQKMQKSLGQAENPHKIRGTRKDIAKMITIMTEKEKGSSDETSRKKKS